jgi:acetyl esterase/lipase
MKYLILVVLVLMAGSFLMLGCETREESIIRERSYLEQYPVEEVDKYYRDVVYARPGGHDLTLDVSAPAGEGPFPVLMIIHGGGWELHTNTIMEGMARYITNRGYVVFNINYRTLPEGASMEEIVEDCLGAFLWIKEHAANYKGDPQRFAVTGDSAGGHLAAMVLTQKDSDTFSPVYKPKEKVDKSITCAAPSYGVFDFTSIGKIPGLTKDWFNETYLQNPERYRKLSPIFHISSDLPPQLVMVGDRDPLYLENKKYVETLKEAGAPVEFYVYEGQSHAFLNNYWEESGQKGYDRTIEFLDKHMK